MKLNNHCPKVSIVVPVYGEDHFLPYCLDSICSQTYKNLEIILVDDGSPDTCPEICDAYAAKDERIKVIHKINGGLVEARKTGIKIATGLYVAYVDGDDEIEPDFIEKLVNIAIDEEVDVVVDGFCKLTNGKRRAYANSIPVGKYDKKRLENEVYPKMMSNGGFYSFGIFTYVWNKLFKRSVLLNNQLNVPSQLIVGEDSSCVYPALLEADSIFVTDICGYRYRQRLGSLLRLKKNNESMVERLKTCYKYLSTRFKEMGVETMMHPQLVRYISSQLLMLSDCLVQMNQQLPKCFPFSSINNGDKVIIYSAGAFGMHYYSQLHDSKCYEVVNICDPDSEHLGDDIKSLKEATQHDFDKIIIASIDRLFIEQAVKNIEDLGVPQNKIITIDGNIDFVFRYCESLLNQ